VGLEKRFGRPVSVRPDGMDIEMKIDIKLTTGT
jgi:hypothetical protein